MHIFGEVSVVAIDDDEDVRIDRFQDRLHDVALATALFEDDASTRRNRLVTGGVGRGIVENHDLGVGKLAPKILNDLPHRRRFIKARNGNSDTQN